jgi:hypothetical protein
MLTTKRSTIHVILDPVSGPDAEAILREMYRKLLFEPEAPPVENSFDEPPHVRY